MSKYIAILLVSLGLAGCGPAEPSKTVQGTTNIAVYKPLPGWVCFSRSHYTLYCGKE